MVWGIASRENSLGVQQYVESLGLTFPILLDTTGAVNETYALALAFPTGAYPQDWVIGTDGLVVYANNRFELEEMTTAIERELE